VEGKVTAGVRPEPLVLLRIANPILQRLRDYIEERLKNTCMKFTSGLIKTQPHAIVLQW